MQHLSQDAWSALALWSIRGFSLSHLSLWHRHRIDQLEDLGYAGAVGAGVNML